MLGLVFYGTTGRFTWRMLATVLGGQSVVIFFGALVARALAAAGGDVSRSTAYLVVGSALALACVIGAGLMRRPWGVTLGWLIQLATLVSAVVVPMMFIVGLIFLALWIVCLVQGARVDEVQAQRAEQALDPGGDEIEAAERAEDTGEDAAQSPLR